MAEATLLTVEQGATFTHVFTWLDAAGQPVSLAGRRARMQVRAPESQGGGLLLDLTSDQNDAQYSPSAHLRLAPAGDVEIYLGATRTAQLQSGGVYDLKIESVSDADEVVRLVQGKVKLDKQVTLT